MDKPFVLILGMHRSGTSCLAGALETCGLFLGEVRRTGRFNARGYFELASLVNLHDRILAANRGSWDAPPERIELSPTQQQQLEQVVDLYARFRPCALKDPRLTVMLDAWETLAGAPRFELVASFRHPVAVARSLASRNRMSETTAIELWQRYNSALVARHQRGGFPLIEYDLRAPHDYVHDVAAMASRLGLSPDLDTLHAFVSQELEHQRAIDAPVPESCRGTYEYLIAHRLRAATTASAPSLASPRVIGGARPDQAPGIAVRAVSWGKQQLRAAARQIQRTQFRARASERALDRVRRLIVFVGNPRSGTTLVRSLLDAHPNVVLGNEVNLLERLRDGEDWPTLAGRMLASAEQFRRSPVWEGYGYDVRRSRRRSDVLAIGDKKAGASARALMSDVWLLDRLAAVSSLPVHVVHCVRNPFDVISTKTMRNGRTLGSNIERYFQSEHTAAHVGDRLSPDQFSRVYLEELIAAPESALTSLLASLDLSTDRDYIDSCTAVLFNRPSKTRDRQIWSEQELAEVARRTSECRHLLRYLPLENGT